MIVYLNRMSGADKRYKIIPCRLFLNADRTFTIYPVETDKFDQIILGNEKPNTISEIRGVVHKMYIAQEGISLQECFIEIDNEWHRDGFLLWWTKHT